MNEIFNKALEGKYAIGQFNISTNEQLKAVIETAVEMSSPVIIGASENERKFIGDKQLVALVGVWKNETTMPILLNADHCQTLESAKRAVDVGFTAIHFDGSRIDFDKNVKITKEVVKYARSKNEEIVIEGELGYLRGGSDVHKDKTEILDEDLTKPEEAKDFCKRTNIDNLAVVIGNIHGIEAKMKNPNLNLERLKEIENAVPNCKIVLHGGSGTPVEDIKESIKFGVIKININTELRVAFSEAMRKYLKENPKQVKPYNILHPVISRTKEVVKEKIVLFKSNNKAF